MKLIKVKIIKSLAIIKFNRPEQKNPLSVKTLIALDETFSELATNKQISAIAFTGAGNGFAAGANLKEVTGLNEKTAEEFGLRGQSLMQMIYRSDKRTIAAIKGFCMGGALDLAISCQFRFASPEAVFAHPGAKLGIITGWGGTQLLPRLIGRKRALEMFITAKRIDSNEALKIGLIDRICEDPLEVVREEFGK
jgi:enoyl-CoA hydratase